MAKRYRTFVVAGGFVFFLPNMNGFLRCERKTGAVRWLADLAALTRMKYQFISQDQC
jgi:hypothetical protein